MRDQIKKLDGLFDAQGLDDLKSDRDRNEASKDQMVMTRVLELEETNNRLQDKCDEQVRINQELADRIQ